MGNSLKNNQTHQINVLQATNPQLITTMQMTFIAEIADRASFTSTTPPISIATPTSSGNRSRSLHAIEPQQCFTTSSCKQQQIIAPKGRVRDRRGACSLLNLPRSHRKLAHCQYCGEAWLQYTSFFFYAALRLNLVFRGSALLALIVSSPMSISICIPVIRDALCARGHLACCFLAFHGRSKSRCSSLSSFRFCVCFCPSIVSVSIYVLCRHCISFALWISCGRNVNRIQFGGVS